uniref:Uncharacterized protein n=1 Tax=Monodon monoceros TaxID=40151 RepID=A0A8C6BHI0_MONMO
MAAETHPASSLPADKARRGLNTMSPAVPAPPPRLGSGHDKTHPRRPPGSLPVITGEGRSVGPKYGPASDGASLGHQQAELGHWRLRDATVLGVPRDREWKSMAWPRVGTPGWGQTGRWAGTPLRLASGIQVGAVAQAAGGGPGTRTCPQLLLSPPPPPPEEGRGERLVELRASLRELVATFRTNSTIHSAIRLVCSSQNCLKTASWGLRLARALGVLCWQLGLLFGQYWLYPVITTVSVYSERSAAQALPVGHPVRHEPAPATPSPRPPAGAGQLCLAEHLLPVWVQLQRQRGRPGGRGPGPRAHLPAGPRDPPPRLSPLGGQNRVGCKLAYSSGVVATREWYHLHRVNVLGLLPTRMATTATADTVFSCRYDGQDRQAQ